MLGLGVMIQMLGPREPVDLSALIGQPITKLSVDDALILEANGKRLRVFDNGQSCCESRYMRTDDDLNYFIGATFLKIEIADAPDETREDSYVEAHEVQFLRVITDRGVITCANHNEHNGYYGGFSVTGTVEDIEAV